MAHSVSDCLETQVQSYIEGGSSTDELKQELMKTPPDMKCAVINAVRGATNATCLHTAAQAGRNDVMRCLLDGLMPEQKVSLAQLVDDNMNTALHSAAEYGHTGVMQLMLDGLLPHQLWPLYQLQTNDKSTLIHLACLKGHKEMVEHLLLDMTPLQKFGLVLLQSVDRCTPLHVATKKGHKEIAKMLLGGLTTLQKFDLAILQEREGKSALHFSTKLGHVEVVKLLLDGFSQDQRFKLVGLQSLDKSTALHIASINGHVEIVKHLLEKFTQHQIFDVTTLRDQDRWTSLHLAVKQGHTEVVKGLLENMTPQQKFEMLKLEVTDGNTALHVAVFSKRTEMVLTILSLLSSTFQHQLLIVTNDKGRSVNADAPQVLCAAADFAMKVVAELADANKEIAALKKEVESFKKATTPAIDQTEPPVNEVKKRRVTFKKKLETTSLSVMDDLNRLLDLNEVPHYQIMRDPRDTKKIKVTGVDVVTLREELKDVGDRHDVIIEPKDITVYLGSRGLPLLSNWIVTCSGMARDSKFSLCLDDHHLATVNAIMQGILKGKRRKMEEFFALTTAHAFLSENQKAQLNGDQAEVEKVHDDVTVKSYSKMYYMDVNGGQEVDIRAPPRWLCKYWMREDDNSEVSVFQDVAFFNLLSNQVEEDGLVDSGKSVENDEENAYVADVVTKEAVAELVGQRIICKGFSGILRNSSRITAEDGEGARHVIGCHLEFTFDDENDKLAPGDCGSFVYLADRVDGKLPIVGMFAGQLVHDKRVHCAVVLGWNIKLAMEADVVGLTDLELVMCAPVADGRCDEEAETVEGLTELQVLPDGEMRMESAGEKAKWLDTGLKLDEKEVLAARRC